MHSSLDKLPINGFDLVLLVVLITGIARGRKLGMSSELLSLLKWLAILFGCALAYQPIGDLFAQTTGIFGTLQAYIIAYVVAAALILLIFALLKPSLDGKLIGSDV